jgi:glyoxylase-like metal-dependent hydrolase (beta-lactamase superfamily II)
MKYLLICLYFITPAIYADAAEKISEKIWNHGSENCEDNKDTAIEIFEFDQDTYILRQNKCLNFEAPFIYVLFGKHMVFVQDTGATAEADQFPLYDTVQELITRRKRANPNQDLTILVTHSHSHGDHTAADAQFLEKPGVTLVAPDSASVREYFGFADWPNGTATVDLGGRELTVLPAPGHHPESVAVYDPQTKWLLTGDSFYPGRLYIWDWPAYKSSIQRLLEFAKTHEISAVMGTHIEMSSVPGEDYPMGSSFQPNEAGLALSLDDLLALDSTLQGMGDEPEKKTMDKFIVYPISKFQKVLTWTLKRLGF